MSKETMELVFKNNNGICPRCGQTMSEYPALSRYADIEICSNCGTDEAMRDLVGLGNNFDEWRIKL